jgi:hypothetical protein
MTAPAPSPRMSPTAGLFNAAVRLTNRLLDAHAVELEAQLAVETSINQHLKGGDHA